MVTEYPRNWGGTEWEKYSLQLVRLRHGAENVQPVPAKVHGDLGIECFTSCGTVYQSYAPENPDNIAGSASGMRAKAGRDLQKLIKYDGEIIKILGPVRIRRWVLLCPFLDDKSVIATAVAKAKKIVSDGPQCITDGFQALIHCQDDFSAEIDRLRHDARGVSISMTTVTDEDVENIENSISETLSSKLARGFPNETEDARIRRRGAFLKGHVAAENALSELKDTAPILWDQMIRAISIEELRLGSFGVAEGVTNQILNAEQDSLLDALKEALPTIDASVLRVVALGQIGTWLIECPLDFAPPFEDGVIHA